MSILNTAAIEKFLNLGGNSVRPPAKDKLLTRYKPRAITASYARPKDLLPEEVFHCLFNLEGRRAKRSRKSFAMMLVNADAMLKGNPANGETLLARLTSTLSVSTRETDAIGWYKTEEVLGILFTEISTHKKYNIPHVLHTKISNSLHDHLGPRLASKIQLTVHPYFDESPHDSFNAIEESSIA
jgi:hypothetical protein